MLNEMLLNDLGFYLNGNYYFPNFKATPNVIPTLFNEISESILVSVFSIVKLLPE